MKKWLGMAWLALTVSTALADWHTVSEVPAGSQAQASELAVNQTLRTIRLVCTEGTVLINTLWVREGSAKTEIRVARRFNKGDQQDIDLGYDRTVTGFRISNQGPGKFKVQTR